MCVGFEKEEKAKSLEEVSAAPQSAFLGPTLWDKTLPYDGDNFQLEYMDLEEFLSENGIPSSPAQHEQPHQRQQPPVLPIQTQTSVVNISRVNTSAMPPACIHNTAQSGRLNEPTAPATTTPFPASPDNFNNTQSWPDKK